MQKHLELVDASLLLFLLVLDICRSLALLALLLQLSQLPLQSRNFLCGEPQALWNLCAAHAAMCETPIVEHSLAAWTLMTHSFLILHLKLALPWWSASGLTTTIR